MKRKHNICIVLLAALSVFPLFLFSSCNPTLKVKATDLGNTVTPAAVSEKEPGSAFLTAVADFSVKLLQNTAAKSESTLTAPLSAYLSLSMVANGAAGNTADEIQQVLGTTLPQEERDQYLYSLVKSLNSTEKANLSLANSIWLNEDFITKIQKGFLQKNADYYGASIYRAPFHQQTIKDINRWVKHHTNNMIPKIMDTFQPNSVMVLLNTMAFDAEWQTVYERKNIHSEVFTALDGTTQTAEMMSSTEWEYLEDEHATGFIKPYQGQYRFAALLPNSNIPFDEYIQSLDGASLLKLLKEPQNNQVYAYLPKFSYESTIPLRDSLNALGIHDAFDRDKANFSKATEGNNSDDGIFLSDVLQKTYISLDAKGTKAGAVTKFEFDAKNVAPSAIKAVRLNRPFVYLILDANTSLPLFIGTVTRLKG